MRNTFLMAAAALLLTLGACQGAGVRQTITAAADIVPFPIDRASSTLSGHVILGKNSQARSAGAVDQLTALVLPSGSATEWAVYEFTGVTQPDHVDVTLDSSHTTAAWIGIANFTTGRWVFSGPCNSARTLPLAASSNVSPLNNVYVAVVAASGETSKIDRLQLFTPNVGPVAVLAPTNSSGLAPLYVVFDATSSTDPDGSVTDYEWDFNGNGIFNEAGAEQAARGNPMPPLVLYPVQGSFTAAVRVSDNGGLSDTATKVVSVDVPPIAALTADVTDGDTPLTVNFDASGSSDSDGTIVDYEWDFDGNGVFNEENGEGAARGNSMAQFSYNPLGAFQPSVRVTDNQGAKSTKSITITVHGWSNLTVDSGHDGECSSLRVVNGYPAIAYSPSGGDLKYAYSNKLNGSSGWSYLMVDSGHVGVACSLAVVNGFPAISYCDNHNHALKYAYSSLPDGSGGWSTLTVDPGAENAWSTSLAVVDGKPAIAYQALTNSNFPYELKYAYSNTTDGSGGWSTLTVDSVGEGASLAVVNGKPSISYFDATNYALKYAYSSTLDGSSGWSTITVDSAGDLGGDLSLAVVNGYPAITYGGHVEGLKYASSSTLDGSSGWNSLTVDSAGEWGDEMSLAVVNGFPAISYVINDANDNLKYAQSNTLDGSSGWSNLTVDSTCDSSNDTSLAVVNGQPAISYADITNHGLKYAFWR